MAGTSQADFLISQQLMQEAEDIYQRLGKVQDTIAAKDKVPPEVLQKFWAKPDPGSYASHNREFGVHVYLSLIEAFYKRCGGAGKFTSTGRTVGECKLWTMLHALKMIQGDVLSDYEGVASFYEAFGADEKTRAVVESGGRMPAPFKQYFVAPEG
mmetsp:Transcript_100842/g.314366  ORF Transcript_100842/g.314366 Transcript_100842/m.314366 type:complete len:155 (+) Transcript_100842:123-587(+)